MQRMGREADVAPTVGRKRASYPYCRPLRISECRFGRSLSKRKDMYELRHLESSFSPLTRHLFSWFGFKEKKSSGQTLMKVADARFDSLPGRKYVSTQDARSVFTAFRIAVSVRLRQRFAQP